MGVGCKCESSIYAWVLAIGLPMVTGMPRGTKVYVEYVVSSVGP